MVRQERTVLPSGAVLEQITLNKLIPERPVDLQTVRQGNAVVAHRGASGYSTTKNGSDIRTNSNGRNIAPRKPRASQNKNGSKVEGKPIGEIVPSDDIEILASKVSLLDCISKQRIKYCTKSTHCNHLACFDFYSFWDLQCERHELSMIRESDIFERLGNNCQVVGYQCETVFQEDNVDQVDQEYKHQGAEVENKSEEDAKSKQPEQKGSSIPIEGATALKENSTESNLPIKQKEEKSRSTTPETTENEEEGRMYTASEGEPYLSEEEKPVSEEWKGGKQVEIPQVQRQEDAPVSFESMASPIGFKIFKSKRQPTIKSLKFTNRKKTDQSVFTFTTNNGRNTESVSLNKIKFKCPMCDVSFFSTDLIFDDFMHVLINHPMTQGLSSVEILEKEDGWFITPIRDDQLVKGREIVSLSDDDDDDDEEGFRKRKRKRIKIDPVVTGRRDKKSLKLYGDSSSSPLDLMSGLFDDDNDDDNDDDFKVFLPNGTEDDPVVLD